MCIVRGKVYRPKVYDVSVLLLDVFQPVVSSNAGAEMIITPREILLSFSCVQCATLSHYTN